MISPDPAHVDQVPLCVDLDGTLIESDLMWESLVRLIGRNPFWLFPVLWWWLSKGRAYMKRKLSARIKLDPAILPYTESFLQYLREAREQGRRLILASASDYYMVEPVARHLGLFDEVLGSDGRTNMHGAAKLKMLTDKFGLRGFDYAGNSSMDLGVWPGAREAIVVNGTRALAKKAAALAKLGPIFPPRESKFSLFIHYLIEFFRPGFFLAVLGGLALAAAFPAPGVAGFAWIAPALMIWAAYGKKSREAFRLGYIAGMAQWLVSLAWLLRIPVTGYPIFGWLGLSAFVSLYTAVWVWFVARLPGSRRRKESDGNTVTPASTDSWSARTLWALTGAAAWVTLEMIRARLLSGFPWLFLGVSQYKLVPLIQFASVTGVYGVSFLVAWGSLSLFSAVRMTLLRPTVRQAWLGEIVLPMTTVALAFAYGMTRLPVHNGYPLTTRIALIQPSIPQTMIWDEKENAVRFQQLLALSERALGTNDIDLLIWPEAALPQQDDATFAAITRLIRTHHVWMIFGADEPVAKAHPTSANDYDVFNSAFLFDPEGQWTATYRKQRLVMFGEYLPLEKWLPFVKYLSPIGDGFAAGNRPVPFEYEHDTPIRREMDLPSAVAEDTQPVKTSVLICFEDGFPQLVRHYVEDDTDFLVNITNDGWFGQGAAQWQQAADAVFRSVENGVPLIRCCNNGLTCWIDSHGRIREYFRNAEGSIYGEGYMIVDIPLLTDQKHIPTYYNRYGDRFGWICVGLTVLTAVRRKLQR